jgi:trehalose/maltose transport system substrate-binding protein
MRYRNIAAVAVSTAVVASLAAACSSGGSSSSGGSGGGGGASGARGPITVVQGKDNSNTIPTLTQMWNSTHPNEKVTFKQQSDSADDQLSDLQQHFQAKDPNYDVVSVDVIWTAQFAAQGWIEPLKGQYAMTNQKDLLPATLKAATYAGNQFAAPSSSDGGLLYYRKDLVPTPPKTWDEMIADCKKATAGMGCYAGQYANYEGLTVNAAEAINTAGGVFVKEDGKTPNVDTPEAKKGLDFLVNGFKQGYIPKDAIGFKETESLNAFQTGKLLFMRQWPYGVSILNTAGNSVVKGKFDIAPLPGSGSGDHADQGASSLGGHSWAMSVYGKHKATAHDFLTFSESDPVQRFLLTQASLAPVTSNLYSDPTLVAKFTYLPTLLKSIQTAVPRPVTPFYPAVTKAIETNVYAALQGQKSSEQALKDLQSAINSAASGGG